MPCIMQVFWVSGHHPCGESEIPVLPTAFVALFSHNDDWQDLSSLTFVSPPWDYPHLSLRRKMFLWLQFSGLQIMCSATLHSRLLLLLSLPAHTPYTHTHSVALRGKGRLPGSVVLFNCLEMVVTRQPEWHFCALSAQVTGFSTGLQNTPLETLTDLSAHCIFLFLPLKGVTKAT